MARRVDAKDGIHKNPADGANPDRVSGRGAQAGVCFLLVTFLCTSKEELYNSRMAGQSNQKKAHPGLRAPPATRAGFAPSAGFFYRTSLSC